MRAEFMDGRTFYVGQRVAYEGHAGTVIDIDAGNRVTVIKVQVDEPDRLPRRLRYMLNPKAAAEHGKPDFDLLRDEGKTAGNFTILED